MLRTMIRGGLLGGMVVFIWTMVSWVMLPWHQMTMERFEDEQAVARVLSEQAPFHGVYILPNPRMDVESEDREAIEAFMDEQTEAVRRGPLAFAAVRPQGMDLDNPRFFVNSFLVQFLAALLLTFLLYHVEGPGFMGRTGLVLLAVLAGGLLCHLPYWNWWHFGTPYTLVMLGDLLAGWFLGGMVIAWATGSAGSRGRSRGISCGPPPGAG